MSDYWTYTPQSSTSSSTLPNYYDQPVDLGILDDTFDRADSQDHGLGLPFSGVNGVTLLTPPTSIEGSSTQYPFTSSFNTIPAQKHEPSLHVSVSTTFYPTAGIDPSTVPDVIIVSIDDVCFYLHSHRLLSASDNGFGGLIPAVSPYPIRIVESSTVFNVVAHAIYGLPFAHFGPVLGDICSAVDALARYGAMRLGGAACGSCLYDILLIQAPLQPFEVYKLAGAHALDELAVAVSAYLRSHPLSTISDEDAIRMGPVYLRRLVFLHLGRADALKRLLLTGPSSHQSTMTCNFSQQTAVTRAWALAAAYLSWESRADISPSQLSGAFSSLEIGLHCALCRTALNERVKQLLLQWSMVKTTI